MNIGISEKNRKEICKRLAVLLANEYVLYTKTLNYHWNVEGRQFHDFHAFFKEQYEQLFPIIDDVAERIRSLGIKSISTLHDFLKHAALKEDTKYELTDLAMIKNLLQDHEAIIEQLREDQQIVMDLGDQGTNNFLVGLMEIHEKRAWMLRAHLAK
jgi:starvation-inducible DNA-binding protein